MRSSPLPPRLLLASLLLLSGCKVDIGGDETPPPICQVIGGGASSVSASPAVLFSNASAAFDGNLDTFASLSSTSTASATLRGTAQEGVVASARSAGIAFTRPPNGAHSATVTITTYLDGVPRESMPAGTQSGTTQACNSCTIRDGLVYMGIPTSQVFDAIEAQISWTGVEPMQIRELCVN